MVRDFALAGKVLRARDLVWKHGTNQVLCAHPGKLRWHFLTAAKTWQRERHPDHPTPTCCEHRRVKKRLSEHTSHRGRMQVVRDLLECKTMRLREGDYDVVLGRGGLQFEIERNAKAFAERQTPSTVD